MISIIITIIIGFFATAIVVTVAALRAAREPEPLAARAAMAPLLTHREMLIAHAERLEVEASTCVLDGMRRDLFLYAKQLREQAGVQP